MKFKVLSILAVLCMAFAGSAFAAVDLTGVTLDMSTPEALAATILAALAVIFGIKKLLALMNRG